MKDKLSLCIMADGLMLISPAVFIYGLCSRIGLRGGEGAVTLHYPPPAFTAGTSAGAIWRRLGAGIQGPEKG